MLDFAFVNKQNCKIKKSAFNNRKLKTYLSISIIKGSLIFWKIHVTFMQHDKLTCFGK